MPKASQPAADPTAAAPAEAPAAAQEAAPATADPNAAAAEQAPQEPAQEAEKKRFRIVHSVGPYEPGTEEDLADLTDAQLIRLVNLGAIAVNE